MVAEQKEKRVVQESLMIEIPMTEEAYRSHPGLSYSSMRDLQVSEYRYWYLHVNPNRPVVEPTPAQVFGTALHCKVLQGSKFHQQFARRSEASDYEGCLVTIEDLRGWLRDKGHQPKGTKKAEVIAQVQAVDPYWPILDVIREREDAGNEGRTVLDSATWERLEGCAASLLDEPHMQRLLQVGEPEKIIMDRDKETGVVLKSKQDWVAPQYTLDLKTFVQQRGKSIDQCIADAIWYEGYYKQAQFYSRLRGWPKWDGDFIMPFVESEPPFEVRFKVLRGKTAGQPNLYWTTAELQTRNLIRKYAGCVLEFGLGEKPWRNAQEIDPLVDEEMKGLVFA